MGVPAWRNETLPVWSMQSRRTRWFGREFFWCRRSSWSRDSKASTPASARLRRVLVFPEAPHHPPPLSTPGLHGPGSFAPVAGFSDEASSGRVLRTVVLVLADHRRSGGLWPRVYLHLAYETARRRVSRLGHRCCISVTDATIMSLIYLVS